MNGASIARAGHRDAAAGSSRASAAPDEREHAGLPTRILDQGVEVVDLALYVLGRGVAASRAASIVVNTVKSRPAPRPSTALPVPVAHCAVNDHRAGRARSESTRWRCIFRQDCLMVARASGPISHSINTSNEAGQIDRPRKTRSEIEAVARHRAGSSRSYIHAPIRPAEAFYESILASADRGRRLRLSSTRQRGAVPRHDPHTGGGACRHRSSSERGFTVPRH